MIALDMGRSLVAAPSPLEGEGMEVFPRDGLGEGFSSPKAFFEENPSPNLAMLNDRPALSLKGRGRSNARRSASGAAI
jgi:hypothetical protein